jgi:hypothetical protein
MANATVSRLGQANGAGSAQALFLAKYAGEVLTAFRAATVFISRHRVREVQGTNSAVFPAMGKGSTEYHTPGTEITGSTVLHNERRIGIDDLLIAPRFIARIDEAMNYWDVRSEYSFDAGNSLAQEFDQNVAQVGVLAARASATVSGGNGGLRISDTDAHTSGASLAASIYAAAQAMDEKDIPQEERFCFLKPAQYYLLAQTTNVINKDWGGSGSYADGKVLKIANVELVKTNNMPNGNNVATGPAAYQGDFTHTVALVMHRTAVGTAKLLDLAVEMEYDIRRQGTLIVAKYAMGHGILRSEAAIEISKDTF